MTALEVYDGAEVGRKKNLGVQEDPAGQLGINRITLSAWMLGCAEKMSLKNAL